MIVNKYIYVCWYEFRLEHDLNNHCAEVVVGCKKSMVGFEAYPVVVVGDVV